MVADQGQQCLAAGAPILKVDRVDDAAARVGLQSAPDHQRIGGVEDERRLDRLLDVQGDDVYGSDCAAAAGGEDADHRPFGLAHFDRLADFQPAKFLRRADAGDEKRSLRCQLVQHVRARHHVDARGHHGRGVDQSGDRRRALHRVGQPHV